MRRLLKRLLRWSSLLLLAALLILVALSLVPISPTIPRLAPDASTRFWPMVGGYRIAYRHLPGAGPADLPPVIFLPGGPGGYVHSSVVRALAPLAQSTGRSFYLVDPSGAGLSDRRERPRDATFSGHVEDLAEIVTAQLGAPRVALVAQSWGALVASSFAARHPELVERLVLTSPGALEPALFDAAGRPVNEGRFPVPPELRFRTVDVDGEAHADTEVTALPVRALAALALATAFDVKLAPDEEVDAALDTMAARFTRHMVCDPGAVQPEEGGAGFYMRIGSNFYGDVQDPRPALRRCEAPVLVLQGQCDFVPYGDAYEYVDLFPRARYRFVEGAGHIIWWDREDEWRAEIGAFLAGP